MSQWFYAEGNRERRGPLPAENIIELFRSGRIAADTLVWREGTESWQPLQAFFSELGLEVPTAAPTSAAPPVLEPPATPPPVQHAHPNTPSLPPGPAVKQGMSGCAIATIIALVVGLILLAILGILAAIALPAYQDYVLRSKTSVAYAQLVPLKSDVALHALSQGRCPVNDEEGFGTPESYASDNVAAVRIGRFENGHCGLEARLLAPGTEALDGKAIWLDYDTQTAAWTCRSNVAAKYLPTSCRG